MSLKIEKAMGTGFCFGVKRAIDILEKIAGERGQIETLRPVVHNQQVMQRLANIGIEVANSVDEIQGNTVVISAHGVSPQVEEEIRERHIDIIDLTCSFVHRAQIAARRLARSGFFVIVYGEADHPEVKGILGWTSGKGLATMDAKSVNTLKNLPRRLGVLSQTTQIPGYFNDFVKKLIDTNLTKDV
jgi:4-hydroxy-3-methylbut-2-enyl diphosphate reductase